MDISLGHEIILRTTGVGTYVYFIVYEFPETFY